MKEFFKIDTYSSFFRKENFTFPNIAHGLLVFLVAFLPFNVLFSTFFTYKIHIPGSSFLKEAILMLLAGVLVTLWYKAKKLPKFDIIDMLFLGYMVVLFGVSVLQNIPLTGIIYGARYDFEFFFALIVAKHIWEFLPKKLSYYLRIAFIYATWALIVGILVRFVFGENILLHFGFSGDLSNWKFGGSVPIYHGIDGANVRRFQGIFDGPNPAAFFILVYMGLLVHLYKTKKDLYFILGLWSAILLGVLFYTYSRSSVLGFIAAVCFLLVTQAKTIWKKYKKVVLVSIPIIGLLSGAFYIKFEWTFDRIILREGSSKGHFDRAITGLKRFAEKPMGSGLSEAGPAYRFMEHPTKTQGLYEWENKALEDYYIPESWYIQQLVEWGIFGTFLFLALMLAIFLKLWRRSLFLASSFVAIGVMNVFLHTFESVFTSLFFFIIIGLLLSSKGDSLDQKFFS